MGQIRPMTPTAVGRITVGTSAVQGTDLPCHTVMVKAISPGQTIDVGFSSAVTSGNGYELANREFLTINCRNLDELFFIASAASQSICYAIFKAGHTA